MAGEIEINLAEENNVSISTQSTNSIEIGVDSDFEGTKDYTKLKNKPSINGVTLQGNKTLVELGIQASEEGKGLSTNDFTDSFKEKLKGLDKILPREEAEGEYINVKDSADYKADLEQFIGNIYQETREGYNKANYNTSSNVYNFNVGDLKTGTDYTLAFKVTGSITANIRYETSKVNIKTAYTVSDTTAIINFNSIYDEKLNFNIYSASEGFSVTEIMLLEGIYTVDTLPIFEQYGAMPSPSFESPIQTTKGKQSLYDGNKNFFDLGEDIYTKNGLTITKNKNKININGTSAIGDFVTQTVGDKINYIDIGVFPAGTYTITTKFDFTKVTMDTQRIAYYLRDINNKLYDFMEFYNNMTNKSENVAKFTLEKTAHLYYAIYCNNSGVVFDNFEIEYQIENGETNTDIIEHQSQNFNLDLPEDFELIKMGDYKDYIYKVGDKWFKHVEFYTWIGDGVNYKFIYKHGSISSETHGFYQLSLNNKKMGISATDSVNNIKSNYLKPVAGTATNAIKTDCIWWEGGLTSKTVYASLPFLTLEEVNQWLADLYAEGKPFKLIYPINEPYDKEITDETLIAQLNELDKNLKTYEGTTNIFTISEEGVNPTLKIKYVQDAKISNEILQSQIDELKTAIVSLGAV